MSVIASEPPLKLILAAAIPAPLPTFTSAKNCVASSTEMASLPVTVMVPDSSAEPGVSPPAMLPSVSWICGVTPAVSAAALSPDSCATVPDTFTE